MKSIVGGGPKKLLYTLKTANKIGLLSSAKALNSSNACKACGLGMGGQRGGMINELDEFPSVCNKSVQAQSTDIQKPIPPEIFAHSLDEFRALSAFQLEHLGRLGKPIYKAAGEQYYREVDWDWALDHAAGRAVGSSLCFMIYTHLTDFQHCRSVRFSRSLYHTISVLS